MSFGSTGSLNQESSPLHLNPPNHALTPNVAKSKPYWFFTPETGIEAAAKGIEMCVRNLREKFPDAKIVVAKILPAHAPDNRFHQDILATNKALDDLKLNSAPQIQVLDLTSDFLNDDGTLNKTLYNPDNIHLSSAGYASYAERLKPILGEFLKNDND